MVLLKMHMFNRVLPCSFMRLYINNENNGPHIIFKSFLLNSRVTSIDVLFILLFSIREIQITDQNICSMCPSPHKSFSHIIIRTDNRVVSQKGITYCVVRNQCVSLSLYTLVIFIVQNHYTNIFYFTFYKYKFCCTNC